LNLRQGEHLVDRLLAKRLEQQHEVVLEASESGSGIHRETEQHVPFGVGNVGEGKIGGVVAIRFSDEVVVELESRIIVEIVVVDETCGARCEAVFAVEHRWGFFVGASRGMMVEPFETSGMIGEVGQNISRLNLELIVGDVLGVDELDPVEPFRVVDEHSAGEPVQVASRNQPHSHVSCCPR
jgi:hypothetical protein